MERLSALDAEFLHMEDDVAHMHIAVLCIFDGSPPTLARLRALIRSKLHLIERHRQRIRTVPFELGRPVWIDDPDFDLTGHVHHLRLDAPGSDDELMMLMGELMSEPLDRSRPLWDTWLVDGLDGDRWAAIFKVHHCMVDGIAGVGLLTALLDLEPTTTIRRAKPWTPAVPPAGPALVADAWAGLLGDAATRIRRLPSVVTRPTDSLRSLAGNAEGAIGFLRNLRATPRNSIEGMIGPHRSWASSSASIDDIRVVRRTFGGTLNDVVLAAVSGSYRSLFTARGEDPDNTVVRAMIPVSVRRDGNQAVADNEVSTLLYELPVHIEDPVERLHAVQQGMGELKASHMAEAGSVIATIGDLAPPIVVEGLTRLALRSSQRRPQSIVDTVVTNVPGPQFPVYCLGHEMLAYYPFVGISYGLRVTTAVLSYNGRLFFGVTGDRDSVPEVAIIADGAAAGIAELRRRS